MYDVVCTVFGGHKMCDVHVCCSCFEDGGLACFEIALAIFLLPVHGVKLDVNSHLTTPTQHVMVGITRSKVYIFLGVEGQIHGVVQLYQKQLHLHNTLVGSQCSVSCIRTDMNLRLRISFNIWTDIIYMYVFALRDAFFTKIILQQAQNLASRPFD